MVDFEYLYKGICGLARAHLANGMAGHLGAAVTAGYFFGEEHPDLDERVSAAVEGELDRIIAGDEAIWFNADAAGITIGELFAPFPREPAREDEISSIATALADNIGSLRQSGHNVIFASIAIRALRDHPEYATPSILDGIRKLITGFNRVPPGRGYYGKQRGWITGNDVELSDEDELPPYRDQRAMVDVVIEELIARAAEHRRGFGGLFHIINHATALNELGRYGHRELAQRGWAAHRHHVRLWKSLPNLEDELGQLNRAEHDPRTREYWRGSVTTQWSARLTHRIKTMYGFLNLLRLVEDPARRRQAEASFRYLMA